MTIRFSSARFAVDESDCDNPEAVKDGPHQRPPDPTRDQ
jgi:hypothetical protein